MDEVREKINEILDDHFPSNHWDCDDSCAHKNLDGQIRNACREAILAIAKGVEFTADEATHIHRALKNSYGKSDEWCSVCDSIMAKLEAAQTSLAAICEVCDD